MILFINLIDKVLNNTFFSLQLRQILGRLILYCTGQSHKITINTYLNLFNTFYYVGNNSFRIMSKLRMSADYFDSNYEINTIEENENIFLHNFNGLLIIYMVELSIIKPK